MRTAVSKSEASFFLNSPSCFFSSPSINSTAKCVCTWVCRSLNIIHDDNTFLQNRDSCKNIPSSIKQTSPFRASSLHTRFDLISHKSFFVLLHHTLLVLLTFATNASVKESKVFEEGSPILSLSVLEKSYEVTCLRSAHDFIFPSLYLSYYLNLSIFNFYVIMFLTLFAASFNLSNSNFANFKIWKFWLQKKFACNCFWPKIFHQTVSCSQESQQEDWITHSNDFSVVVMHVLRRHVEWLLWVLLLQQPPRSRSRPLTIRRDGVGNEGAAKYMFTIFRSEINFKVYPVLLKLPRKSK